MAIRSYTDRDGHEWSVWAVTPAPGSVAYQERFRAGWVCFERVGGGARCRLPFSEVPAGWESLSDDRLDLLRRVAETTSTTRSSAQHSADASGERDREPSHATTSARPRATNEDGED
jgi:hypothetical protein